MSIVSFKDVKIDDINLSKPDKLDNCYICNIKYNDCLLYIQTPTVSIDEITNEYMILNINEQFKEFINNLELNKYCDVNRVLISFSSPTRCAASISLIRELSLLNTNLPYGNSNGNSEYKKLQSALEEICDRSIRSKSLEEIKGVSPTNTKVLLYFFI